MPVILRHLRSRLLAEDGFTLVTVMGVITVVMILSAAAYSATNGDQRPGLADRDRKAAYAAAEAGVADYLARLTANPDYWRGCAETTRAGMNNVNPGSSRTWATVPTSTARYSVEILPANGATACSTSDPVGTFIDADTGTFRIRSTGQASPGGRTRSVIATFKRRGFLDYIYFTEYETGDPAMFMIDAQGRNTRRSPTNSESLLGWAKTACKKWRRDNRQSASWSGQIETSPNNWVNWNTTKRCQEIRFVGNASGQDKVEGPFHTNDEILICGSPKFGRRPSDEIEVSGPAANAPASNWGYYQDGGCSGVPEVNFPGQTVSTRGTWERSAPIVNLPATNASLKDDALPAYRFKGRTRILLQGNIMTVTGKRENGIALNAVQMPMPKDGVIFVDTDRDPAAGSCPGYSPYNPELTAGTPACGDAIVSGTYERSLTILADNDVVVPANLTAVGTQKPLLGLIANQFVRVDSPVSSSCSGGEGQSITIHAAILALQHSFTVDRYWCGPKLGELNIVGAIGQMYRGPVGTGGNDPGGTGYIKNYDYNDELRFRSPPRFLDPVQTTWKLKSQVEQVPAAS